MDAMDFDFGYYHPDFDGQSALSALKELLDCVYSWRNELSANIAEPDLTNIPSEYANDIHVDKCHSFVYQDVACCNAAIGSIAPCLEGLFRHEFALLRVQFGDSKQPNTYHRWKMAPDDFWIPTAVSSKGKKGDLPDIVRGISQLVKSLELGSYFPDDLHRTLQAIFRYRNVALHQGYEWPLSSREHFMKLVSENGWDDWFSTATSGGDLWVIYANDTLIKHSIKMFSSLLDSFSQIHNNWVPKS